MSRNVLFSANKIELRSAAEQNAANQLSFITPKKPASWTKVLLLTYTGMCFVAILAEAWQANVLTHAVAERNISSSKVNTIESFQMAIGILDSVIYTAVGVSFLVWFHRVYKNLPFLGARYLKYAPLWTVIGFFLPLLNLVRPFQIMREVVHVSHFSEKQADDSFTWLKARYQGASALIICWWIFFLASEWLKIRISWDAFILGPLSELSWEQVPSYIAINHMGIVSYTVFAASGIIPIFLIKRVTTWQIEKWRHQS